MEQVKLEETLRGLWSETRFRLEQVAQGNIHLGVEYI